MLADAGYPVISAKKVRSSPGTQIALYEVITLPTLFDLVKEEEDKERHGSAGKAHERGASEHRAKEHRTKERGSVTALGAELIAAQQNLDKKVSRIYQQSWQPISQQEHASAPIHQLFSHRLQLDGRLGLFYQGKKLPLGKQSIPFDDLAQMRWTINGIDYPHTLSQLIATAQELLKPQAGVSIIGHGDAHNGNLFVDLANATQSLAFFDPAFAGRHSPLLDLTKPLFHNVFARWMYHPEQVDAEIDFSFTIDGNNISVKHNFLPSLLRQGFLTSRIDNVLQPTVALLAERKALQSDWKAYLRAALFCCPFLTVNLCATPVANGTLAERYPSAIKLLGLCMAVELGSKPDANAIASDIVAHRGSSLRTIIDSIFASFAS
jgi:hypothetical protein